MKCSNSPEEGNPERWAGRQRIYFLDALATCIMTISRKTWGEA